jgi:hypothetical protein
VHRSFAISCNRRRLARLGVHRRPATHSAAIGQTIKRPECGGALRFRELTNIEISPISASPTHEYPANPASGAAHNDPCALGGPRGNFMPICGASTDSPSSLIPRKSGSSLSMPCNRSTRQLVPGHDVARPIWSVSPSGLAFISSWRCERPSPCRSSMWAAARSCGSKPDRSMLESR